MCAERTVCVCVCVLGGGLQCACLLHCCIVGWVSVVE